jgi:hypothetical protein
MTGTEMIFKIYLPFNVGLMTNKMNVFMFLFYYLLYSLPGISVRIKICSRFSGLSGALLDNVKVKL